MRVYQSTGESVSRCVRVSPSRQRGLISPCLLRECNILQCLEFMIADGTAYNARSMFFGAERVNVMNDEAGVFLAVSGCCSRPFAESRMGGARVSR